MIKKCWELTYLSAQNFWTPVFSGIKIQVGAHLDSTCYCNNCQCEYKCKFLIFHYLFSNHKNSARYPLSGRNKDYEGNTVEADKLFMHPNYNLKAGWDYCLVQLKDELEFDCSVKPIGRISKILLTWNKKATVEIQLLNNQRAVS